MRLAHALAPLLLAAAALACRLEDGPPFRRVFLVTVDTLRADHLGSHGYPRPTSPALDELARRSAVFEWAIAQWPKTGPSFASMFTGQYPLSTGLTHHAAVRVPEEYLTLPEFLKAQGFATVAVNSNGVLNTDLDWHAGFDEYLETRTRFRQADESQQAYRDTMNARRVNELALPLLDRHRSDPRLFAWIHYSDPHTPYLLPRGFENPFLGDGHFVGEERIELESSESVVIDGRMDLKYYVAQYDANVLVVDQAIGELLRRMESLDLLDDALVVFTADHGESLGEHGYYCAHGRLPYNPTTRVPLFVWWRGIAPRRVVEAVELVDLYPTLRDLTAPGAEVAGLEGESLAAVLRGEGAGDGARYAFSQAGGGNPLTHFRAVQDATSKLVFHPPLPTRQGERQAVFEFYDLARDPLEGHDLMAQDPPGARRLRAALFEWMGDRTWIRPPRGFIERHSQETLKALRALGYLGN